MSAQTQSGFKFSDWYEKNKARLSEKRKKLYRENSEFRDSALRRAEVQRKRRQDNPEDTQGYTNGFSDTAEELGITVWTLREWRRKSYFPEPKVRQGRLWFNEHQVSLLGKLRDFFAQKGLRVAKEDKPALDELVALVYANWQ